MIIRKGKFYPYGVKVKGNKELAKDMPLQIFPAPERVYISLSQHIGAPATPVVAVGDEVVRGQVIGEAAGFISAPVHASVSGTVEEIKTVKDALSRTQTVIVIKNDYSDNFKYLDDMPDLSPQSVAKRAAEAGIVGLGGAGFPTSVKLSPKNTPDTLIVNGAECEPYLTCDHRLMTERTEEIYQGALLAAKAVGATRIIFGIETNKPDAIEAFSKYDGIEIVKLKKRYPVGSEKHLIYMTTGRKVPPFKIPADVNCVVQNVKTLIALYRAVKYNEPVTTATLTVSGRGVASPKNLIVPLGTPVKEILAFCGGEKEGAKLIMGGPMMGKAAASGSLFIRKTDSGILSLKKSEISADEPSPCINCGTCARHCPMRLMPMYIEQYYLAGDYKNAEKYGANFCIECGSCAYGCPAKRPLVQNIVGAKAKLKEMKNDGKK